MVGGRERHASIEDESTGNSVAQEISCHTDRTIRDHYGWLTTVKGDDEERYREESEKREASPLAGQRGVNKRGV